MIEELRQEFFQTFPDLAKSPQANALFSTDKRYLNEICSKYNAFPMDKNLEEAKNKLDTTTSIMKENVSLLMGNQEQAHVTTI